MNTIFKIFDESKLFFNFIWNAYLSGESLKSYKKYLNLNAEIITFT